MRRQSRNPFDQEPSTKVIFLLLAVTLLIKFYALSTYMPNFSFGEKHSFAPEPYPSGFSLLQLPYGGAVLGSRASIMVLYLRWFYILFKISACHKFGRVKWALALDVREFGGGGGGGPAVSAENSRRKKCRRNCSDQGYWRAETTQAINRVMCELVEQRRDVVSRLLDFWSYINPRPGGGLSHLHHGVGAKKTPRLTRKLGKLEAGRYGVRKLLVSPFEVISVIFSLRWILRSAEVIKGQIFEKWWFYQEWRPLSQEL